jgi:hypothetical protein
MAHRHRFLAFQPPEISGGSFARLAQIDVGPGESALFRAARAARARDRPAEARFHHRGVGIHVLAVEVQAGLQAQGVARAQADRPDRGICEQLARQGLCFAV